MKSLQAVQEVSLRASADASKANMGLRSSASLSGQPDMARLRIERNREVRHARAAMAKFTFRQ